MSRGASHHLELWVPDLARVVESFGWLLETLGYHADQQWTDGRSWRLGGTYIVIEQSPALTAHVHDRCRPGLNHVAFHVGDPAELDAIITEAQHHGWTLMFADAHPNADGPDDHAGFIDDTDGFEVELVADVNESGSNRTS